MNIFKTTKQHADYWSRRKIDWNQAYLQTANHPHRNYILGALNSFPWTSLFEVGCGPGANLLRIVKTFKGKQVGGCDINRDAIELAKQTFKGALLKVGPVNDIMLSDNSVDVVLSDRCLIYVSPKDIDKTIKEIKRIARNYVVFAEFHHKSWWERFKLKWKTGYNAYDYKRLLEKHDFYDIITYRMPKEYWPEGDAYAPFDHIIVARITNKK